MDLGAERGETYPEGRGFRGRPLGKGVELGEGRGGSSMRGKGLREEGQ